MAMDLNHDGKITRSDITGTKARLGAMGGDFDLNHDGRLDVNEFDRAGGRILIDGNRDGQLTPNESYSPFKFPTGGFGSGFPGQFPGAGFPMQSMPGGCF